LREAEGKRLLGIPKFRWEINTKIDLGEIGWDGLVLLRIGSSE
jgi:hypothetical protein